MNNIFLTPVLVLFISSSATADRIPASSLNMKQIKKALSSGAYSGILLTSGQADNAQGALCGTEDLIKNKGCARAPSDSCPTEGEFAYYAGSCWDDVVPEMMSDKSSIFSITDDLLEKNPVNTMALSLLFKHYQRYELPRITAQAFAQPKYSLYRGIQPQIMFKDSVVEKIVNRGFLNQHQSHSSGGILSDDARWETEEAYMDIRFENHASEKAKELAPKYLYGVATEKIIGSGKSSFSAQYGNMIAVLAPSVRNRMTVTMGDSLDLYRVDNKRRMNTLKWLSSTADFSISRVYLEGQVWGTLDLSHVEYFLVNCPGLTNISSYRQKAISEVTNLPIYSCSKKSSNGAEQFVPKSLLYGKHTNPDPDPAPDTE
jgi:hypothetical protein